MSKAQFNLDRFIASVKGEGLARVNRFEVILNPPLGLNARGISEKTSLYCEVANFPPLSLNVKPFKIFGPSYQRPISSEYGGDGMSMTFHVDSSMGIKRFFDDWLQYIVDKDSFTVRYQDQYASTIIVRQLDEENNVTYEIELLEAFPRSSTVMDLNMSAQNQTHRLNIIFAYRYWRRTDNIKSVDIVPKVSLQTQPIIPFNDDIPYINETESSRVAAALGGPGPTDPNVDFSNSTFSVPSA